MRTFESQKYGYGYRVIAQDSSEIRVMAESLDESAAVHMARVMNGLELKLNNPKEN